MNKLGTENFPDISALKTRLLSAGCSPSTVKEKSVLLNKCYHAIFNAGLDNKSKTTVFYIPGRIEALGKHTDYAGGRSILANIEKGFIMAASGRTDSIVRIFSIDSNEVVSFSISGELLPRHDHWSNYPMTVARRLAQNFSKTLRGADIAFSSDLLPAAGMSSSSAMIVGFYMIFSAFNDISSTDEYLSNIDSTEDLADYLGNIENGSAYGTLAGDKGVGTTGGSEDHTAILCCRPGIFSQYSFCPIRLERQISMPAGYTFAIGYSGVIAEKTGKAEEKYNRASQIASTIIELWRRRTGRSDQHISDALGSDIIENSAEHIRQIISDGCLDAPLEKKQLLARFEQFFMESEEIIPAAGDALLENRLSDFGRLVDKSQILAETHLGNQIPETVFLARSARDSGAVAASSFGAGFGGSVWAMVKEDEVELFLREWALRYKDAFPDITHRASFFQSRPGPAAFCLK